MEAMITVGMPVYNAMPYLPEAVESLLEQNTINFEILAVVDGATDGSLAYLQSIRDPRLRLLTQTNQGVARTLNRILRECRTPWLVRQDADDISHPHRLARTIDAIHEHPHAGMFYSLANYHPRDRAVGSFRCSRGTPEDLRSIVHSGYLLAICHPTATLNVAKTLALGGYRLGLHNEDADLWWRMALEHDIHCMEEELIGFRQNSSSVSTLHLAGQFVAGLYVQYLLLSHLWKRTPRALREIRAQLEPLSSPGHLIAKQRLRSFNMRMSEGRRAAASAEFVAAVHASPSYVWGRFKDEFLPSKPVFNGVQPHKFLDLQEVLWP